MLQRLHIILSFNFVVRELFLEAVQSIGGTVTVQVQRVQDVPAREGRIMHLSPSLELTCTTRLIVMVTTYSIM